MLDFAVFLPKRPSQASFPVPSPPSVPAVVCPIDSSLSQKSIVDSVGQPTLALLSVWPTPKTLDLYSDNAHIGRRQATVNQPDLAHSIVSTNRLNRELITPAL